MKMKNRLNPRKLKARLATIGSETLKSRRGERTFRRILVAVDGSEQGAKAAKIAAQMARFYDAKLVAICVVELREMPVLIAEAEDSDAEPQCVKALDQAAAAAADEGVNIKTVVRRGHIADQILHYIDEFKPDIILLGSRGTSRSRRLFIGSVPTTLLHHCKTTIMVVR